MSLTSIMLVTWGFLIAVVVVGYGGVIDSLRRWENRGGRWLLLTVAAGLIVATYFRASGYMSAEREAWIAQGRVPADSVSRGFDTKSRFRSMAQPLGRIMDRRGRVLAEYRLRDDHLVRAYPVGPPTAHIVGYWTGPLRDGVGVEKALTILNDSLRDDLPHDVRLSLDVDVQQDAMRALAGNDGAIVVIDAGSGEVIAAANNPVFDPVGVWSDDMWGQYVRDMKRRPLTSRAVKDNFSPGSSIKVLIAAAALSRRTVLPEAKGVVCTGAWTPSSRIKPITEHGSAHGAVDLARAMRVSCNIYFARLAYEFVGFDVAADYLEGLGFNERLQWNTGLALNRYGTLLPASSWVKGRDEIAKTRLGIGQASVKTNPIHFATVIAGIANGGVFLRPALELGRRIDTLPWRMTPSVAERVRQLMREPLKPGGTAVGAFPGGVVAGITVYGKTGTADPEPDGREPSWFVSFGEKEGRRYVVVVAIQNRHGQMAGGLNAPMARKMYESLNRHRYFDTR